MSQVLSALERRALARSSPRQYGLMHRGMSRVGGGMFTPLGGTLAFSAATGILDPDATAESSLYTGVGFLAADAGLRTAGAGIRLLGKGHTFHLGGKGINVKGLGARGMSSIGYASKAGYISRETAIGLSRPLRTFNNLSRFGGALLGNAAMLSLLTLAAPGNKDLEEAASYLNGTAITDYLMKESKAVRGRMGGIGAKGIQMNEQMMSAQNQAMAMVRGSATNTMLGREAQLMHN